jgi:hypothetical protein
MSDLEYTDHARDQMAEREISKEDVEMALKRTLGSPLPGDDGATVHSGYATKSRVLKVVLTPDGAVKTAMWKKERR